MRLLFTLLATTAAFNKDSIEDCSRVLSEYLLETFERVSGEQKIIQFYEKFVESEQYDPRVELKRSKAVIEKYLKRRAEFAYKAKVSLEARDMKNSSDVDVNDPSSKDFIRFMSTKQGNDATIIYEHSHVPKQTKVESTRNFTFESNANFYTLATSPVASAVHIPTPLYDREPEFLRKIEWSEIDAVYRTHRDEVRDLAFQLFCSESGYMRFYPAASWFWDNEKERLDLFDCRNTEWYINAATNSKNVLIMLDMSGSMLGQRYEIAKQTTEAILETLSHNDYFNIMPFSKESYFLDDCGGERGLLQATMRNKKLLRTKMNNVTSEGKAEYKTAIPTAFTALLNLPKTWTIYTKEEFAMMLQNNQTGNKIYRELADSFFGYDKEYEKAISQSNGRSDQGCENVIMLITDGAPSTYKELFDVHNKDKKVRVFSFLIGEEAIDFEQVKQIACDNRGFMVHIQNMADVEEKVQHYIRTMSRAVGIHAGDIGLEDALWTGVYRERLYLPRAAGEVFAEPVPITNQSYAIMNKMASKRKIRLQKTFARSRMFVTTVSFPVVVNQTFMGVAAVNIPLTELRQLAHPTNIGGKSYFFMMDQNGFIMFHPQLRAIDPNTKYHKPNYNNMDILELEVPQTQQIRLAQPKEFVSNYHCERGSYAECVHEIRQIVGQNPVVASGKNGLGCMALQILNTKRMILRCDNSDPQELDILFANEVVDRVWPQTNIYYAECIEGANFVLGLAVAKGDDYRLRRRAREYNYGGVRLDWMNDKQWRIHSHWRYCLLNDTDANMTKEEAFMVYAKQMAQSGKLPELCLARRHLVDKLLIDLEATSAIQEIWDQQWQFMKDNLIHLTFFTSPSGLIRFYNQTLDDYDYSDPNWNILDHIGSMLSMDHVQESYNHFITDLYAKSVEDPYFKRSIRMKGDIVFDVSNKSKIWYKSETQLTEYGLNENLTMLSQATKAIYMGNALLGVAGYEFAYDYLVTVMSEHGCAPTNETDKKWCLLLDEHGYIYYSNWGGISYEAYLEDPLGRGTHIGHWFGDINRVSQRAMALLVEKRFYTKLRYIDHQAMCKEKKSQSQSACRSQPFYLSLLRSLWNFSFRLFQSIRSFTLLPLFLGRTEAYTSSFHEGQDGVPCAKASYFYYANKQGRRPISASLVDGGRYERPCPTTKCSVRMQASYVEGTNLVMVWLTQEESSSLCYDTSACPIRPFGGEIPFGFERQDPPDPVPETCDMPPHKRPASSKAMCYNSIEEELAMKEPCSLASSVLSLLPILLGLLL